MSNYRLSDLILDKESRVYFSPVSGKFNYTDGEEIEQKIYNQIKSVNDVSIFSRELISCINDWPSEYHFSPVRHNLLRQYNFKPTDNILELGCGCGAITRQLGESNAIVTAVEGSPLRAKCTAERCRDLANVKVYCSNFQDISFDHEYDFVTLIGVLEYSSTFLKGDKPFSQCLEIARSALKKDGKLIIAIENRVGLKYFLGYSEDHTGIVFDGIRNFYEKDTAYTFGKKEITDLLLESKFNSTSFAYPFPDYKLPKVVVFEQALTVDNFEISDIISQTNSRDYSNPNTQFPEEKFIWHQLKKNNLLADLSNSFLIEASIDQPVEVPNILVKKYSTDRKRKYNTETIFLKKDSNIRVVKKCIENSLFERNNTLLHELKEDEYAEGRTLDHYLSKAISKNNFKEFIYYFNVWLDFIFKNGIVELNKENKFLSVLKQDFIDSKPCNIIKGNNLKLIDAEWKYMKKGTVYSLLIRYLMDINLEFINKNIPGTENAIIKIFSYLKIEYNNDIFNEYKLLENEIFNEVFDSCYRNIDGTYSNISSRGTTKINYIKKIRRLLKRILIRLYIIE